MHQNPFGARDQLSSVIQSGHEVLCDACLVLQLHAVNEGQRVTCCTIARRAVAFRQNDVCVRKTGNRHPLRGMLPQLEVVHRPEQGNGDAEVALFRDVE